MIGQIPVFNKPTQIQISSSVTKSHSTIFGKLSTDIIPLIQFTYGYSCKN